MTLIDLLDRPIAFHPPLVDLGIGITGALMLGQALYWSRRTNDPDGWFYKTAIEWEDETRLTRFEQEGARRRLREAGFIEEEKRGVPCKLHYRVNLPKLEAALISSLRKTSKLDCGKPAGCDAENQQTNTETTKRLQQGDKGAPEIPDWIPAEAWQAFAEHRKKIKAPLTPHAINLAIKKLAEYMRHGDSPVDVIEQTILNNWTGLFPVKRAKPLASNGYQKDKQQRRKEIADEIRQRANGHGDVRDGGGAAGHTLDGHAERVG